MNANRFKKIYKVTVASLVLASLFSTSCTKNFTELNTNPGGVTDAEANADYGLISAFLQQGQRYVIPEDLGQYQLAVNLGGDAYAGYFTPPTPFAGNANNITYNLIPGWYAASFNDTYIKAMNPLYKVEEITRNDDNLQDIFGFTKIVKVAAMHRTSDKIGPIIYSKYNKTAANGAIGYDSQEEAYKNFFLDLDTATTIMREYLGKPVSAAMRKSDLAYTANNYEQWLKFANSLRLRLALRIAYVNPSLAKQEGEKALLSTNGGLLVDNADNCFIRLSVNHPLNTISTSWSDTRMGASIESILGGYQDPRLAKMFNTATDPAVVGQYKGIRAGVAIDAKSRYEGYSVAKTQENQMQLMTAAEAWFMKAEAAVRGWSNAGTAKTNYESGIQKSFELYEVSDQVAAYIDNSTRTMAPYVDPKSLTPNENNIPAGSPLLSTITIKWQDGDSNAEKLERIITQKWIAIFPDGDEAWAEYRRTGYPKMFPNIVNYSGGKIETAVGIRRLPFSDREYNSNATAVAEAIQMLNGPDNGGTRLWWDVENKSF